MPCSFAGRKALASENVDIIPVDLTLPDFVDSLDGCVYRKYGHCDYLFNVAGVITKGTVEETDIDRMTSRLPPSMPSKRCPKPFAWNCRIRRSSYPVLHPDWTF